MLLNHSFDSQLSFIQLFCGCIPSIVLIPKLYVFVGRGHDPADQVAVWNMPHSTKALTNLLPTGGVMTPPYEKCIFNCDKLLQWRSIFSVTSF